MNLRRKPPFRSLRKRYHQLLGSETVLLDGVRLDARAAVVGVDVRHEIIRGNYEFAERQLLKSILRPGDRVVEIGAGIGAVGLLASRIVGPKNVTSFEANPGLEQIIRGNYALNKLEPELVMKAVTPRGGSVKFFVTPNLLSSSLHSRDQHQEVEVESEAIGNVLSAKNPSVLVLDVEGAEVELLPPANLSGVRALLIEMHPNIAGKEEIQNLESKLEDIGFSTLAKLHRNVLMERKDS